jgi:GNAT superfamily N-acetyltransferase
VFVDDLDRPVAYLLVEVIDAAAHIEWVSVHPESARRGRGEMLIEAAAGWAKQRGLEALTLTTYRDVPWNRPYYERLGFRIVGEGQMTAGLIALRAREVARGLDRWPRVAMRRPVDS